jgi:hypothetical protein
VLKVEADFDPEEAAESAAKRCCLACSRAIVKAIQSLEAKTPLAQAASWPPRMGPASANPIAKEQAPEPEPAPAPVVIGRTHKVYGPDKSSFGNRLVHSFFSCLLPALCMPACTAHCRARTILRFEGCLLRQVSDCLRNGQ